MSVHLPFLLFCLENRVYEAGYFHAISRNSKLTVNLVHLYEKGRGECQTGQISRAIEQIEIFKADVVLLYTCFENIELILQQVNVVFSAHYIILSDVSFSFVVVVFLFLLCVYFSWRRFGVNFTLCFHVSFFILQQNWTIIL